MSSFARFQSATCDDGVGGIDLADPGGLTDPQALEGADAVLVTHEHFDHFSEEALREAAQQNPALRIWTNTSVAGKLDGLGARVTVVGAAMVAGFLGDNGPGIGAPYRRMSSGASAEIA